MRRLLLLLIVFSLISVPFKCLAGYTLEELRFKKAYNFTTFSYGPEKSPVTATFGAQQKFAEFLRNTNFEEIIDYSIEIVPEGEKAYTAIISILYSGKELVTNQKKGPISP